MQPRGSIRVLANRGVSGIDGFVSTAQGVAIGHRTGPTTALCGDLSLLHDTNGLIPGPAGRPDLTYVVLNNDGGGIFSLLPQGSDVAADSFERLFGTPHRMSLERLAAAYEAQYIGAETASDLAAALDAERPAGDASGVRIVEVRTDRADNARLHARLRRIGAGGRAV
jgi:2-succinyl-5-enolpyruvyl-6-hydroxy-3-cyclohexene-1-carboxylate synthase